MKTKISFILLAVAFFFAGCDKIELGKEFYCHMGTKYRVDKNLSFIINSLNDSRCPENVMCAVPGDARLNFSISLRDIVIDTTLYLNPTGKPPNAVFGGYDFGIYGVDPVGLGTTSSKDVTIKMVISRP